MTQEKYKLIPKELHELLSETLSFWASRYVDHPRRALYMKLSNYLPPSFTPRMPVLPPYLTHEEAVGRELYLSKLHEAQETNSEIYLVPMTREDALEIIEALKEKSEKVNRLNMGGSEEKTDKWVNHCEQLAEDLERLTS